MSHASNWKERLVFRLVLFSLLVLVVCNYLLGPQLVAAQLGSRSIIVGTSRPSVITTHQFIFDTSTSGNIGSIEFRYCTNSPVSGMSCTAPPGLSVLTATINNQQGATGFSMDPLTTSNDLIISRVPAVVNPSTLNFTFGNITNPSTSNQSVYVRITTYAATSASGPLTDDGSVVFAITTAFGVGAKAYVPPWLVLCVGSVVALTCSNQQNQIQNLGTLTSRTTGFTTTQFSIGTNDPGGYNVYIYGPTLTSGNNTITPLSVQTASQRGVEQFGINLVANANPSVGTNPFGTGTGVITGGYNQPNLYKFGSGDLIASSNISTDFNLFTVSYIANVNQNQPEGVYSTTMTYVGTAAF